MGQHLSQRYGHVIPVSCFDSCQLTTTWMCKMRLQAPSLAIVAILGTLCWEQMGGQTDSQKEGPMVTQYEQNFSDE